MPLLVYSSSDFPFVPFSKIYSADVNQTFNDIKTLLNTTGLDSTNIQVNGILANRINISGGTAGQFLGNNGTNTIWTGNPLTAQFNVVMGSAAQVTAGTATNSTFAGYTQADGDRVLILPGYATNEAVSITKKLYIQGLGNTSQILGAITLNTGASYTRMSGFRTTNNLTIASGVVGCYVNEVWFSGTNTFVDNNGVPAVNVLFGIQE